MAIKQKLNKTQFGYIQGTFLALSRECLFCMLKYIKRTEIMREKLEKLLKDKSIKDIPIIYVVRILIALEGYDV